MKLYKFFVLLLFLLTTLAFPWGSELCQGCRIDSSALAGPIYTFPNSQLFQQMISTNGTFLFQDAIDRLPAYSIGVKLEIRTQTKAPLRLAYDANNYADFQVGSAGDLTINATGGVVVSSNGNVVIKNGNVGIGTTSPSTRLEVAGMVSSSTIIVEGTITANRFAGDGSALTNVVTANVAVSMNASGLSGAINVATGNNVMNVLANGNIAIGTTNSTSKLQVNGSVAYKVVNKSTNYTAGDESIILVNASAGNVTINLPAAASASGRVYQIKKTDNSGNRVSIVGNGSETIDGAISVSMNNQYAGYVMLSDGSNWLLTSYFSGTHINFATGGTITEVGGYRIHTFTSSGTFTVNLAGNVDYLVVAGGGGGGSGYAGGGGAGGLTIGTLALTAGNKIVTVGEGGPGGAPGGTHNGIVGQDSVFDSITSAGGGYGGEEASGGAGGSGGGGGWGGTYGPGNTPSVSPPQGNNGGLSSNGSGGSPSGGGGGAGGVGGNAVGGSGGGGTGGIGGEGIASSISGSSVTYAGGGGGGTFNGGIVGAGGAGGGGAGSNSAALAISGLVNTGGGGGGGCRIASSSSNNYGGGSGGSGIVIIRYPISQ